MNKCNCSVFCSGLRKSCVLSKLTKKKEGGVSERKIVAMIGKEIIRLKHSLNKYRDKKDKNSQAIYFAKCIEIATARMLFTEAKIILKETNR